MAKKTNAKKGAVDFPCIDDQPHAPATDDTDGKLYCVRCKADLPGNFQPSLPDATQPAKTKKAKAGKAEATAPKPAKKKRSADALTGLLAITKDPRVYRTIIARAAPQHKRFVGLDLGTRCGIAFCDIVPGHPVVQAKIVMGQWDLSVGDYDTGPLRHIRLKQFLAILQPDLVFFEDVKFVGQTPPPGTTPTMILARAVKPIEFIGGLKTTLTVWCQERGIPCQGVPIGAIKRWLTGKGIADKEAMLRAANERFGAGFEIEDYENSGEDNIADAAAVCGMAVQAYSEGMTGPSVWESLPDERPPPAEEA